jgi:hypothetical protein
MDLCEGQIGCFVGLQNLADHLNLQRKHNHTLLFTNSLTESNPNEVLTIFQVLWVDKFEYNLSVCAAEAQHIDARWQVGQLQGIAC